MARTMSDLLERAARALAVEATGGSLDETRNALDGTLSELDAERAAHEETKAEQVRVMQRMGNRTGGSLAFGRIRVLEEELAALKARLALAEAVCESCGEDWPFYDDDALAAWRAGK